MNVRSVRYTISVGKRAATPQIEQAHRTLASSLPRYLLATSVPLLAARPGGRAAVCAVYESTAGQVIPEAAVVVTQRLPPPN
jgi:hypothetical protein